MTLRRGGLTMALALLLAACGAPGDEQLDIVFPQYADDGADGAGGFDAHRKIATQMGLVTFDTAALVQPGLAERWVISDDGLSYIFRLGDHEWSDGKTVTAGDIVILLNRRLRALRRAPIGSELAVIGDVIARTDEVIEIQLDAPVPRLLDLLASPELTLARRDEGLGPMTSIDRPGGGLLFLLPGTASDDRSDGSVSRPLVARSLPPAEAVAAYEAGMADMLIDMRYATLPLVQAADIPDAALVKDHALGHFGLDILRAEGPLSTAPVREAIAMSLDRPSILAAFGLADWREMTTISPPDLTNRGAVPPMFWTEYDMADRKVRARTRIAEAGLTGERVAIFLPENGPGSALLYGLLRQDFADIGLRLERSETARQADLLLVDRVADFDDPLWYLARLGCIRRSLCDPVADLLVEEARNLTTLSERISLLANAEQRLAALGSFIPIAEPLRFTVTRTPLPGLEPNLRALHPLQYLAARPDR